MAEADEALLEGDEVGAIEGPGGAAEEAGIVDEDEAAIAAARASEATAEPDTTEETAADTSEEPTSEQPTSEEPKPEGGEE